MKYAVYALIFALLISCNKEEQVDYVSKNDKEIQEYLQKNNLSAEKSSTGLYYIISELGSGLQPTASSTVTVAYKGYYTNDKVFDESSNDGISFELHQVIKGWTEGITYFKEGGNGMLLVPAHLGYGSNNNRGIPGGSVLIFDIALIEVN